MTIFKSSHYNKIHVLSSNRLFILYIQGNELNWLCKSTLSLQNTLTWLRILSTQSAVGKRWRLVHLLYFLALGNFFNAHKNVQNALKPRINNVVSTVKNTGLYFMGCMLGAHGIVVKCTAAIFFFFTEN